MAALSDIIKRVSAGNQAAKESLDSGGTREQARSAAEQAAGTKGGVVQSVMQDAMRQFQQTQEPSQGMAPGMQRTASGDTEEVEASSMTKDRQEKKDQKDEQSAWDAMVADPSLLAMPSGSQMQNLTPDEQAQWAFDTAIGNPLKIGKGVEGGIGDLIGAIGDAMKPQKAYAATGEESETEQNDNNSDLRSGSDLRFGSDLSFGSDLGWGKDLAKNRGSLDLSGITGSALEDALARYEQARLDAADRRAAIREANESGNRALADNLLFGIDEAQGMKQSQSMFPFAADYTPGSNEQSDYEAALNDLDNAASQRREEASQESTNQENSIVQPTKGSSRSQMQEYYDWLANTDEGRAFADMYADYADTDLGYSTLRASNNRDAWGYLLGLQGNQGVDNWRNRYEFSGVDFSDENAALDNLMDYLYGANAVNIYDYMQGANNIQLANDADAIGETARYLANMYGYGPEQNWASQYGLDANDVAALALARQVSNNGWGNLSIDQVNDILAASGETGRLSFVDDDDYAKNHQWREGGARSYGNAYSDSLANLVPYTQSGLADQDITSTLMAAYNNEHAKKLGLV